MKLFCGMLLVLFVAESRAEDFSVDEYDFTWRVAEAGDLKLSVRKDNKSTTIWLQNDIRFLILSATEAQQLGESLSKFSDYQKRLNTAGASERLTNKDITIEFSNDEKLGFHSVVQKGDRLPFTLRVYAKEAKVLTPHLLKAEAMAEFVNKKIAP